MLSIQYKSTMQALHGSSRALAGQWHKQQQRAPPSQCPLQHRPSRVPTTRVLAQQQQQSVATVSTQQEGELTEKEVMSRAYNEQMQKQMGWNNPYEV